jgi:hypothetical protein
LHSSLRSASQFPTENRANPGYLPAKKKKGIITWFSKVSVKRLGKQLPGVHRLGKKVPCVQPPGKLLPCVQAPGKQVPEVQRFGKQLPCTCLVPKKQTTGIQRLS